MRLYFIHNGQNEEGPYELEELKLKAIKGDTPVWYEGLRNWTTANDVQEIRSMLASKHTPPPLFGKTNHVAFESNSPHSNLFDADDNSFQTKVRKFKYPIIVGGVAVVVSVLGILFYQNSKNDETIDMLQNHVAAQDQFIQTTQNELSLKEQQEAEKEAERKRINAAITAKNRNYRNNWFNYISVERSSFNYREIGGIYNLEVIVTNDTEYMLDEVEVQVGYIKSNGGYYKTETVHVYNVPSHSAKSAAAPDSPRGTSVSTEIMGILSKKMHFCYAAGNWANSSDDPYFCK